MRPAEGFHSEEVRQETLHTLSLVEPFLRADDTIVDVGTGNGYVAWQLGLRRPGKVTAVDVGDFRRAPVERFQIVDGAKLPFPDDTFDVALLAFVLHHVPNESKP